MGLLALDPHLSPLNVDGRRCLAYLVFAHGTHHGRRTPFTQALPGNAFRETVMLDSFVQCQVDRGYSAYPNLLPVPVDEVCRGIGLRHCEVGGRCHRCVQRRRSPDGAQSGRQPGRMSGRSRVRVVVDAATWSVPQPTAQDPTSEYAAMVADRVLPRSLERGHSSSNLALPSAFEGWWGECCAAWNCSDARHQRSSCRFVVGRWSREHVGHPEPGPVLDFGRASHS